MFHFCDKIKESFFESLNETDFHDNKEFWGVAKPLLSITVVYNERIAFLEDDKIIENEELQRGFVF